MLGPPLGAKGTGKRWLFFLLIQLVVVCAVLEIVLRVAGPRLGMRSILYLPGEASHYDVATTLEDLMDRSVIGFSPYKKFYGFVLNSRSMRTKEYSENPPAGTQRVLAFGDSFTFASGGLPNADHWPTMLEKELSATHPVEVLRLGVPGTGPRFQFRLWQIEGKRLGAQVVIHAFFVGNDFFDHLGSPTLSAIEETDLGDELARHWLTYRAVRNLRRVARATEKSAKRHTSAIPSDATGGYELPGYARDWDPDRATFEKDEFIAIEARRLALCRREDDELFERVLEEVGATLLAFGRSVEKSGARYVVMLIPDEYQVSSSVLNDVLSATDSEVGDYDLDRPQRRLSRWLVQREIEVLDLLPFFAEAGRSRRLYNLQDTHWNREGNQLAARLLAAYLEGRSLSEGWSPCEPEPTSPVYVFADGLDDGTAREWQSANP